MIEVADDYGILRSGNSNGLHNVYIYRPKKVFKCKQRSPALFAFAFQPQSSWCRCDWQSEDCFVVRDVKHRHFCRGHFTRQLF